MPLTRSGRPHYAEALPGEKRLDEGIYGALGARVRNRRAALEMSQQAVAIASGLTRSSVASIETGRQSVAVHHLYSLARALDTSPQELLPPVVTGARSALSSRPPQVELFVASVLSEEPARRRKGV